MNVVWLRVLRSGYRKEPVISFIVTAGMVEAAIGGLGEQWFLMTFGLSTVGGAMALLWWQQQRRRTVPNRRAPIYALPSHSSRPSLPLLTLPKPPSTREKR